LAPPQDFLFSLAPSQKRLPITDLNLYRHGIEEECMGAGWEWHRIVKISLYTARHQFQRMLTI
jgi:hypothetical protein